MEKDLQGAKKRLLLKVLFFDIIILFVLAGLSLAFASRYKQRLAEQLAEAFRAPLIAGDNRQIMLDMRRPVLKDFFGLVWEQKSGGYSFSLPENFTGQKISMCGISVVKI